MKIGITERGDAGINLAWTQTITNVDGAILISKNFTDEFITNVLAIQKPVILHCTCTGYGGTELEPCVPDYKVQLDNLKRIIDLGFPAERCVLRIDPIFPSCKGLRKVYDVIEYFQSLNTGVTRVRVSVVDEYPHVRERYARLGWESLYGGNFYASFEQLHMVADILNVYDFTYELCAENHLAKFLKKPYICGCVSPLDLHLMGFTINESMQINPQNRSGCHCLSCKTELLTERKQCPHGCIYCFWKN